MLAVWLFLLQKEKPEITCQVQSIKIGINEKQVYPNLRISYNDTVFTEASAYVLTISNTGNTSIESKDYQRPLTVHFNSGAQILQYSIIERKPNNIDASLNKISDSAMAVSVPLLNQDECFKVQFLCIGSNTTPTIDARIKGMGEIKAELADSTDLFYIEFIIAYLIVFVFNFAAAYHMFKPNFVVSVQDLLSGGLTVMVSAMFFDHYKGQ